MAKQILTTLDFVQSGKIINLPDPVNSQDAATKNYVDVAIEGLGWKDNVKVASTANISLASPGASIDGIAMALNDRFLAKDQTDQTQNGIYIWNGAAVAATRALDANTASELLSAVVTADQGTSNGGTTWRQQSVNITLGTSNISFTSFGVVSPPATNTTPGIAAIATQAEVDAGAVGNKMVTPATLAGYALRIKKFAGTIGDGSATQIDVAHNLNSNDVTVQVVRNSAPYDNIECDIERPSANIARLRFNSAPAASAFRVVVVG